VSAAAREFAARSAGIERAVAAATVLATGVVLASANHPLDLWVISQPLGFALAGASALASAAVAIVPRDVRAMAICAGLATLFWGLRAVDLLTASIAGEQRLWTAAAVHALLASFVFAFYRQAMIRHGFMAALTGKERRRA
jgi:hypothetical protein